MWKLIYLLHKDTAYNHCDYLAEQRTRIGGLSDYFIDKNLNVPIHVVSIIKYRTYFGNWRPLILRHGMKRIGLFELLIRAERNLYVSTEDANVFQYD